MAACVAGLALLGAAASACSSSTPAKDGGSGGAGGASSAGTGGSSAGGSGGAGGAGTGGAGSGGSGGATGTGGSGSGGAGGAPADGGTRDAATGGAGGGGSGGGAGGSTATDARIDDARADGATTTDGGIAGLPAQATILPLLVRANDYFMAKWPNPGIDIVTDRARPSNIWTRGVYYEGLMGLHAIAPQTRYYDYAVAWGTSHAWGLQSGAATRNADDQCAGQTYIDLYRVDARPERLRDIKAAIDAMVASTAANDWTWVDAIQMSMPVFAKLGALTGDARYFTKMYAMYRNAKTAQGTAGLYSPTDHLWWRDGDFDPPYVEPNGQDCYWSRGNGWVYAALVRVLDALPANHANRAEYLADFVAMSEALRAVQRSDGFWNVSLHDPTHFGGPELTGTSLFVYGMAWGVRTGALASATYVPVVAKGWTAMASTVHTNGFLGYVQGTGKQPSDGQPVTNDSVPNFEDYGLGAFLLGGSEVWRLSGR